MLQVKIVPVTAFQQNCSIVWDSETKEAVLIDAGGDAEILKAEVEKLISEKMSKELGQTTFKLKKKNVFSRIFRRVFKKKKRIPFDSLPF